MYSASPKNICCRFTVSLYLVVLFWATFAPVLAYSVPRSRSHRNQTQPHSTEATSHAGPENHTTSTNLSSALNRRNTYSPGDVLWRLYNANPLPSSQLDMFEVCDHPIVNPPSPEGFLASGADKFVKKWREASLQTPGFLEYVDKYQLSAPEVFVTDLLAGENPLNLHIHSTPAVTKCSDIFEHIRIQDPALIHAVYYQMKHINDFFVVTRANVEVYNKMEQEINAILPEVVEHFTWREDDEIVQECKRRADLLTAGINSLVMATAIFSGALAPLVGTALVGVEEGVLTGVKATMGVVGRELQAVGEIERTTAQNTVKWLTDNEKWTTNSLVVTGIAITSFNGKDKLDGLQKSLCKDVPTLPAGSDRYTLQQAVILVRDAFRNLRNDIEGEATNIKNWQKSTYGGFDYFDYLQAGSFYLNSRAEAFYLDRREHVLAELNGFMTTQLIMTLLRTAGSGVHCAYRMGGCTEDIPSGKYCVEQDIACQVFSYLPWKEKDGAMYQIPHWGSKYLNMEGGASKYGFDTRTIAQQSWDRYKQRKFEPDGNDLANNLFDLLDGGMTRKSPAYLPVCFDPEGIWPQGNLGPDPMVEKFKSQPWRDRTFPCSCGHAGEETLRFFRQAGLFNPDMVKEITATCQYMGNEVQRTNWTPWQMYKVSCLKYQMEDQLRHTTGYYAEFGCQQNMEQYRELVEFKNFTNTEASCYMCAHSTSFLAALKLWRERHPYYKSDLLQWCANFIYKKDCEGTPAKHEDPQGGHAQNWCHDIGRCRIFPHALDHMVELSKGIADDRTYVSNEYIMRWGEVALWYDALAGDGQGGQIPVTGRHVKEDLKRLAAQCPGMSCANLVFTREDPHDVFNLRTGWIRPGFDECRSICDGQEPKSQVTSNPTLEERPARMIGERPAEWNYPEYGCQLPKFWVNDLKFDDVPFYCRTYVSRLFIASHPFELSSNASNASHMVMTKDTRA